MRVAPVGLVPGLRPDERAGAAQLQSALTHGHPTALAASDLTAHAVHLLAQGAAPGELTGLLRGYAAEQRDTYHEWWLGDLWLRAHDHGPVSFVRRGWDECLGVLDRLDAALAAPDRDADPCLATGAGWIAEEALATGLLCFLLFPDEPVTAVRRAACSSGDSDSIACLAGAFSRRAPRPGGLAGRLGGAARAPRRTTRPRRPLGRRRPLTPAGPGTGSPRRGPGPARPGGGCAGRRRRPPHAAGASRTPSPPEAGLAPLDRQQPLAVVADLDAQFAGAEQVAGADQQAQQVHGVLPAGRAVRADVGLQLPQLAGGIAREALVDVPGQEGAAQGEEFLPGVVHVLDERGVEALQDVGVGA